MQHRHGGGRDVLEGGVDAAVEVQQPLPAGVVAHQR